MLSKEKHHFGTLERALYKKKKKKIPSHTLTIRHHCLDDVWPPELLPLLLEVVLLQQRLQRLGALPEFLPRTQALFGCHCVVANQLHRLLRHAASLI